MNRLCFILGLCATLGMTVAACSEGAEPAPSPPAPEVEAVAAGSVDRGQRLFLRCASCHAMSAEAVQKIGPHLDGVVGREAGSVPGARYSPAMHAAQLTWDEATLDRWLENPQAVVPETSMAFAGLPDAADRQALIAYLKSTGG